MKQPRHQERHIGRKVWYSLAIVLSVLILLLSVAGIIGTWTVQGALSDLTVTLLVAVENTAGGLKQVTGRIDEGVGEVRSISGEVSDISSQISDNVENRGLIALLLPEEQEQRLTDTVQSIEETLGTIADVLRSGVTLYNSIDQLPFVNLPKPSQEKVDEMQASVEETQAEIDALRQSIQVFRTGVSSEIDKVTEAADRVTEEMDSLSSDLAALDSDLTALEDFADRMQSTVPVLFSLGAVLITLLLLYGGYTQVEMIRMVIARWRKLGQPAEGEALEKGDPGEEIARDLGQVEADEPGRSAVESPGEGEEA